LELEFTEEASNDIGRIRAFLVEAGVAQYREIVADIIGATETLRFFPEIGVQVTKDTIPGETRDYFYKEYCLRYLITPMCLYILRIWHQKENERNL